MMIICAWCNAVMTEGEEPPSHGICDECMALHFGDLRDDCENNAECLT